jgi:hypothetical protein
MRWAGCSFGCDERGVIVCESKPSRETADAGGDDQQRDRIDKE